MKDNPIIQAVFDIWYDGESANAVTLMGKLLSSGIDYKEVKQTDTFNIPEIVRRNDPNLKRQPIFEVSNTAKKFKVIIGDGSFGVAITSKYEKWSDFKAEITSVFQTVLSGLPLSITRTGMKYTDHMQGKNVFADDGNVVVSIRGQQYTGQQNISVHGRSGDYNIVQSIMYPVEVVTEDKGVLGEGSLIDTIVAMDNIKDLNTETFLSKLDKMLDEMHDLQKQEFRKVITDEFAEYLDS